MSWNWVDVLILSIFLFSALAGFGRGIIFETISLAMLLASFAVAVFFANPLANYFMSSEVIQNMLHKVTAASGIDPTQAANYLAIGISFGLIFAVMTAIGAIINILFSALRFGPMGLGNRTLGAVFGLGRGYMINLVLIFVLELTPIRGYAFWKESKFVEDYQPAVQHLGNVVSPTLSNFTHDFIAKKLSETRMILKMFSL